MKKNKTKQTKTFWLVALVVALVAAIGLVHHSDDLKELANKDEDPITEIGIKLNGAGGVDTSIVYKYENGMTWEEFLSINDNITGLILDEDGCLYATAYSTRFVDLNDNVITGSDELIITEDYYGPYGDQGQAFGYCVTISFASYE